MTKALVTGSAGFIGYHVCSRLLEDGYEVFGIDALSEYYDLALKKQREERLRLNENFRVLHVPIETPGLLTEVFDAERPDVVIHLAAQAGVRYSIDNPRLYLESNIAGTFELLEAARAHPVGHLLLASTSSAYGANSEMPYVETSRSAHQMSFYAATKASCESMAHAYSHLYSLPVTMFRFFTVYGPWGRPDMALFKFTKAILAGHPIEIYNHGEMQRDFTYIDDLVEAIRLLIGVVPVRPRNGSVPDGDSLSPVAPWRLVNIGNSRSVRLLDFIDEIEAALGKAAIRKMMPMQAGDVPATWANVDLLRSLTGFEPRTSVKEGVAEFVAWYREYYPDV
ncbi:MAG: GDP-mannose 4,6-dehydratase [Maritimibacter sp.]|nr:GDP-mannose 4,6-dehydratase [Maritimibacter sp.]